MKRAISYSNRRERGEVGTTLPFEPPPWPLCSLIKATHTACQPKFHTRRDARQREERKSSMEWRSFNGPYGMFFTHCTALADAKATPQPHQATRGQQQALPCEAPASRSGEPAVQYYSSEEHEHGDCRTDVARGDVLRPDQEKEQVEIMVQANYWGQELLEKGRGMIWGKY